MSNTKHLDTNMMTVAKSVLLNVAQGHADAFADCVDRFGSLVWTLAQKFSDSNAEAESAAQEIFADIWQNAPHYGQVKCSEKIFVAMLARRRLIDRKRNSNQSFDQNVDMDALFRTLDHVVDDGEACEQTGRVRKHLKKLPIDQARVLLLAIHHGCLTLKLLS